jgi:hypothetical protein
VVVERGRGGGEARFWLGMMEKSRSDFEKANLQAYINPASKAMKEVIHVRGKAGEDDLLRLLFLEGYE